MSSCDDWSISTAPRLGLSVILERRHGVVGVGIEWAEAFHLVALGRPAEGVLQVIRVEHTPAAVDQRIARIACLLALDRHTSLRPLISHGEHAAELAAIARDAKGSLST